MDRELAMELCDKLGKRSVLEVCLSLAEGCRGSADMNASDGALMLNILDGYIESWVPNQSTFDNLIHSLILETIREFGPKVQKMVDEAAGVPS